MEQKAAISGITVLAPRDGTTVNNPVVVNGKTGESGDHTCTLTPTAGGNAITQVQNLNPGAFTFNMGNVATVNYDVDVACGGVVSNTNNFDVA
jgi:hypothetical protein